MKHPNNFQRKIGTLKSSQIETKVTNYENQGMLLNKKITVNILTANPDATSRGL